ncbi:peptidoglycan DD-metalloendopeptidase family protein [Muricauda sp. JGD-17]|uniref:Peptidoglycan DD-metalloendopeptidase family protein n=1 Tax=Flagellimonas ochracea TaxID=2696472 RepID=A0A964WW48_9FLAO|nr:M23 family metallopeptidase [Allomuricauda ochracea]NAY90428.1 peptidoglycan DD-metalloendopeptidase family protein [Allomuricauda ochracea]
MRLNLFGILFLFFIAPKAQEKYPKDAFRAPLDIPLILAGTFGELRSNHFHSGIDIKTQRREGLPIRAIADGTVTRIKVSHWGYGKALYVAHPNGYTSVYAHLQKFGPEIEDFVKNAQYQKQSYEVELFPDYGELEVSKGTTIAYSGNTGGSSGPHLHFEIRSSVTEKPTNPLLYGYEIRDATNPTLLGLFGYPLSNDAVLNQSTKKVQLNFSKRPDGSFLADRVTAIGTIGFGFNGFDRQDMAANKNGVYAVKQLVNGKVYSEYDFETFSFGETRYINTLIDYEHFGKYGQRIQKCFKEPYNRLSIYKTLHNDGKINVKQGLSCNVELYISDVKGNEVKVIIPVDGKRELPQIGKETTNTNDFVFASKPNSFDLGAAKVYFPANTFYEDFPIHLEKGKDTITIHNNSVAAHRNFTISFDATGFTPEEKKQLFIARLDENLQPRHSKTYKRDGSFTTRTRALGTYTLVKDSVAPTIVPKNFKERQWLNNYRYLSVSITDDMSGINSYNAWLNGDWILMEYEPKTNTLTYNFDDKVSQDTQCELRIVVTDNVGNSSTFTSTFFRK